MVDAGVGGLLRRGEATPDTLTRVITRVAAGEGEIPADLLGRLLGQVGRLQRQVLAPRGMSFAGLSDREEKVLRLVADGHDTAEIATRLCYSQRTVKNVHSRSAIRPPSTVRVGTAANRCDRMA